MASTGRHEFKDRLIALNLLTAGVALIIATTILVTHEYFALRDNLTDNLGALAQVIAENSAASLAFKDDEAAAETLNTLKAVPHVTKAAIYTRERDLFAHYRPGGGDGPFEPAFAPAAGAVRYYPDHVDAFRPVMLDRQAVGMVFIQSDLRDVHARLVWYAATSVVVVVASLGAAFLLLSATRRKLTRAEEAVHVMNQTLEQRVAARTAELEQINRELEAFSYSVSHDLRAPLRAINGFSHLLLESEHGRLSDGGRNMLERVVRNSNRMGQLIDDILEYSRAGRSPLVRTEVDIDALARTIAAEAAEDNPAATVEVRELPAVEGDRTMLRQVLENLIGNALKYSGRREHPRLEVGALRQEGETIYYVKDNGAGFDMRYAGKLFGMFQRMHADGHFPGSGVGLAIVKRLVERHGGRIWGEAEPDCGATFFFTIGPARKDSSSA